MTINKANPPYLQEILWLGLPSLACIYALSSTMFLYSFKETPNLWQNMPSALLRVALVIIAVATYPVHSSNPVQLSWLYASLLAVVALYALYRTRVDVIEGGNKPVLDYSTARDGDTNETKQLSTNNAAQHATHKSPTIVVITGGNAGIGKETARLVLESNPNTKVVLACRSPSRAQEAIEDLVQASQSTSTPIHRNRLDTIELDLSSIESVRKAAANLKSKYPRIDVLVNNAGIMMGKQEFTKDGHELVMQANYIGHYLWTRLLLDAIPQDTGRVLNVTSSTYCFADQMDLQDLMCTKGRQYSLFGQYAQSKLANILFTRELARRYPHLHAYALHPGMVRTEVTRNMPRHMQLPNKAFALIVASFQKTPQQGGWTSAYLALAPLSKLDESGTYWVNCKVQGLQANALDDKTARDLWSLTAKLVGLGE
jgi:retinol dehydrogenase 12